MIDVAINDNIINVESIQRIMFLSLVMLKSLGKICSCFSRTIDGINRGSCVQIVKQNKDARLYNRVVVAVDG